MTSIANQRINLTRHMDWEHGVPSAALVALSLASIMEKHRAAHPHDLGEALAHRSHLVDVLQGTHKSDPTT